jgi:hypothetical protein
MDKGPLTVGNRTMGSPFPNRIMPGELSERVAPAQADALQLTGEWSETCTWIPEPYASGIETDSGPF